MTKSKLYAVGKRECWKLGEHYTRHSLAMTAEGLHKKSDIAAELAVRDAEIERLEREVMTAHAGRAAITRPPLHDLFTEFGQAYHKLLTEGAEHAPRVEAAEAAIQELCNAAEPTVTLGPGSGPFPAPIDLPSVYSEPRAAHKCCSDGTEDVVHCPECGEPFEPGPAWRFVGLPVNRGEGQ